MKENHSDLPSTSAGRLMITKIPVIHPGATISEVENLLIKKTHELETINYIYAVDGQRKLIGVMSVKEVFRTTKTASVSEVMIKDLVTVRPHTDQERAALLAIEHNLKEIPVVDKEGKLLGVISNDTILHILHEENVEDMLLSAGIHKFKDPIKNIIGAPVFTHYKRRFPWLTVGLIGGFIIASVVGFFEESLKTHALLLASFIPAIAYIGDAVGTQAQMLFIRSLAIEKLNMLKYLWREIRVAFLIAVTITILASSISYLIWNNAFISAVLGLSFLITIIISISVAIILPWFFSKIKIDPAIASGPFATIIRDLLNLTIYFTVARIVISSALF